MSNTSFFIDKFPIYGASFIGEDELLLAGGGGPSKTGLANRLACHNIARPDAPLVGELKLAADEDAPMCLATLPNGRLAISGVNESAKARKESKGDNCHLRTFKVDRSVGTSDKAGIDEDSAAASPAKISIKLSLSHQVLDLDPKLDDYQKLVRVSASGKHAAILSAEGRAAVVDTTKFNALSLPLLSSKDKTWVDVCVCGEERVLAATERAVYAYALKGKNVENEAVLVALDSYKILTDYRIAKFATLLDDALLLVALNPATSKRQDSYLALYTLDVIAGTATQRQVIQVPRRIKDLHAAPSPKRNTSTPQPTHLVGVVYADGALDLYAGQSLDRLKSWKPNVLHAFPPSAVAFSPGTSRLATVSIDGKCNILDLRPITHPVPGLLQKLIRPELALASPIILLVLALVIAYLLG
ncbi:hypothetical protein PYCC9005_005057 [Savitreella phatthalungensis]